MFQKWICVLHFYQPPFQKPKILGRVVDECYLPLTNMLIKQGTDFCIYFNLNKSLIEQLVFNNHLKVLDNMNTLLKMNKVRLTLTPSFHPIIPLISKEIVIQQLADNKKMLKKHFNIKNFDLFFPPELAYDPNLKIAKEPILINQSAIGSSIYCPFVKFNDLNYLVRHTDLSNMIMGGELRSFKSFNLNKFIENDKYFVTAVDAETFGHHRKGYISILESLLNEVETCWVTKETDKFIKVNSLKASSWSSVNGDLPFILWKDDTNELHQLLWQFVKLIEKAVKTDTDKINFHKALSSCTFWWASANPWWSIEMVESGAWQMYKAVCYNIRFKALAHKLYTNIVLLAFKWQREGLIDAKFASEPTKTIPFSKRCKKGELEKYINKFKKAEAQATTEKNYELAIKWRDAVTKLLTNTDQFDDWHVVDQLRNYTTRN